MHAYAPTILRYNNYYMQTQLSSKIFCSQATPSQLPAPVLTESHRHLQKLLALVAWPTMVTTAYKL